MVWDQTLINTITDNNIKKEEETIQDLIIKVDLIEITTDIIIKEIIWEEDNNNNIIINRNNNNKGMCKVWILDKLNKVNKKYCNS